MKLNRTLFLLIPAVIILLLSCRSGADRLEDFALQSAAWEDRPDSSKPVYITGTKPIDSIDVNKLIFDIWRIEIDEYPKNLKVYARVYDSLGNFVTHMANPYKKDSSANYWTAINEELGVIHKRTENIDPFSVREYGANDSIPYNIVLTVDYSGSMSGVMKVIFEGTELFVSMKQKYDNIALTTFNHKDFDIKVPLMNDKEKILNTYSRTKRRGLGLFSAVKDAVMKALDMYKETAPDVPRVLVVFSDGDDNYSKAKIGDLIMKAKREKIHIFAIAFGYSKDDNLRYMAEYTGGKFYKAYTKEELIAIFRDIYMSLRYYYYITYTPPEFWGLHNVISSVNVPGRTDTLFAEGDYNTSDLYPWDSVGTVFERPINFDFAEAVIKPDSYHIINEIVQQMYSNNRLKLEIQGHTDNIGSREFNIELSTRRAKVVYDSIVANGINPNRLRYRGFGFSVPKVPNTTDENRAKNRRTEFHVLAK